MSLLSPGPWSRVVSAFALALAAPSAVVAQDEAELVPPRLLSAAEADFPAQARAAGLREASVLLRITVDVTGRVTAAQVVEPAGYGFDEAARVAALMHRFEPARRAGEPIAARVLLRIDFRAPPEPPVVAAPPHPVEGAAAGEPGPAPGRGPTLEVTVRAPSDADRLRRSAEAVHVVETTEAKRRTADLGEVLARTQGVSVQRRGGLGSQTRFSLNGLTDDQVRFFLDGVPLRFAGYPFGLANVPVNLVERVEVYRGVVPIRFGADALGGAVNLVSEPPRDGTRSTASLQAGSFGTYRATLDTQHLHAPNGFFVRASGFFDRAGNDYPMDILVPDERARQVPARVYRFHDAYRAQGGRLEVGVVDQPWADALSLGAFASRYDKEVQHNLRMTFNPYGDVELGERSLGGTLRYAKAFRRRISLSAVGGYAHGLLTFRDLGECVYDWFGQCLDERLPPGEISGVPHDQRYLEHSAYGRVNLAWMPAPAHALRLSLSPTFTARTGEEKRLVNPDARDPLSAQRELTALVSGVEYQLDLVAGRLSTVLFAKDYLQWLRSEDPLATGAFRREDRVTHRGGLGSSLRWSFVEGIYVKASYEWATRLPRPEEVFGNAFPVQPNLGLKPELSHNVNLGLSVEGVTTRAGAFVADMNGFVRQADQLIALVGDDQTASYQNVYSARSLGFETSAGWTSPGEYVALDGNLTYVDFRNTSRRGAFEDHAGDRIPNRPYLFANGSARLQARSFAAARDELALVWTTRYVHPFLRGWEGLGDSEGKLTVPAQLLHSLALTYFIEGDAVALSFTGEVQNLTDRPAYDFFGVLKPGRAFYFKATASL